jgi:hypothetical protein
MPAACCRLEDRLAQLERVVLTQQHTAPRAAGKAGSPNERQAAPMQAQAAGRASCDTSDGSASLQHQLRGSEQTTGTSPRRQQAAGLTPQDSSVDALATSSSWPELSRHEEPSKDAAAAEEQQQQHEHQPAKGGLLDTVRRFLHDATCGNLQVHESSASSTLASSGSPSLAGNSLELPASPQPNARHEQRQQQQAVRDAAGDRAGDAAHRHGLQSTNSSCNVLLSSTTSSAAAGHCSSTHTNDSSQSFEFAAFGALPASTPAGQASPAAERIATPRALGFVSLGKQAQQQQQQQQAGASDVEASSPMQAMASAEPCSPGTERDCYSSYDTDCSMRSSMAPAGLATDVRPQRLAECFDLACSSSAPAEASAGQAQQPVPPAPQQPDAASQQQGQQGDTQQSSENAVPIMQQSQASEQQEHQLPQAEDSFPEAQGVTSPVAQRPRARLFHRTGPQPRQASNISLSMDSISMWTADDNLRLSKPCVSSASAGAAGSTTASLRSSHTGAFLSKEGQAGGIKGRQSLQRASSSGRQSLQRTSSSGRQSLQRTSSGSNAVLDRSSMRSSMSGPLPSHKGSAGTGPLRRSTGAASAAGPPAAAPRAAPLKTVKEGPLTSALKAARAQTGAGTAGSTASQRLHGRQLPSSSPQEAPSDSTGSAHRQRTGRPGQSPSSVAGRPSPPAAPSSGTRSLGSNSSSLTAQQQAGRARELVKPSKEVDSPAKRPEPATPIRSSSSSSTAGPRSTGRTRAQPAAPQVHDTTPSKDQLQQHSTASAQHTTPPGAGAASPATASPAAASPASSTPTGPPNLARRSPPIHIKRTTSTPSPAASSATHDAAQKSRHSPLAGAPSGLIKAASTKSPWDMPLSAFSGKLSGKLSFGNGYVAKMPTPIKQDSSVLAPTSSSAARSVGHASRNERSSLGRSASKSSSKPWNSRF